MLWTTAAQSVSKNITCTSVRIRGAFSFSIGSPSVFRLGRAAGRPRSLPLIELRRNSADNFFDIDGIHAAEIDRAFPEKTGTALDLMADDIVSATERTGEARFGGTENRDHGNADERGEMHRAGVVGEKQRAFAQLGRELIERRFADAIQTVRAQRRFDRGASFPIGRRAEEDPLHGTLLRDGESDFGETFREPAFRRAVFRAGTQSESRRRTVGFDARKKLPHFGRGLRPTEFARHSKIMINLVLTGTAPRFLGHDLIHQPAANVSRKTDELRDAREP